MSPVLNAEQLVTAGLPRAAFLHPTSSEIIFCTKDLGQ